MSKFLKLLEMNEPTDDFKDPDDAVVDSIKKLCDTLKIPHEDTPRGLLILNQHDESSQEEEQEDPAKAASALGALLSVPDQKEGIIFKSQSAQKINNAKRKIADGISQWADNWLAKLQKTK